MLWQNEVLAMKVQIVKSTINIVEFEQLKMIIEYEKIVGNS